jgi:hypothetical protein
LVRGFGKRLRKTSDPKSTARAISRRWVRLNFSAFPSEPTKFMTLIDLATKTPEVFTSYTIAQIVAICGDGKLRDNSPCSEQLRQFLTIQQVDALTNYANYCLENKFERSGFALQDCINEIGRRLGYEVKNGRYAGVQNDIGFDGLWFDGKNYLVVEVKTTDAYRVNLDRICGYSDKIEQGSVPVGSTLYTLIVVGRQDTGDLEAQIRGSRHAWNARLISVEALTKLMFINEDLGQTGLQEKVRRILLPFEYTKVDNIVDLVFETQQEAETKATAEADNADDDKIDSETGDFQKWNFTPKAELDAKRLAIVDAFFKKHGKQITRHSRVNFSSDDNGLHVTCAVSKRYKRDYQPYWYALHPPWLAFLEEAKESFFVLGCMDRNEAFAIPLTDLKAILPDLNKTTKPDKSYWHIATTSGSRRAAFCEAASEGVQQSIHRRFQP